MTGQYMKYLSKHQNCLKKEHADLTGSKLPVTENVEDEDGQRAGGEIVEKRHESVTVFPSPESMLPRLLQPLHLEWAPSAKVLCALATPRIHFFCRKDCAERQQESAFSLFSCE